MIFRNLKASWIVLRRRMVREKMSAEDIAAGWALGMFVGCSIPFGLQLIVSVPLAMMMRVSKIGATFGTLITNPVTIFFIYPAQTYLMNKVLFDGSLSFDKLMAIEWTFETVRQLGAEVMVSFFLGGLALSMIMTPITYFSVKWIVKRYRR